MRLPKFNRNRAAFTLAETMIAACIALAGMGAAMVLNTAHLRLVKSSRQSNAATLSLQERVEQMRLADWRKITNGDYLKDVLLASSTKSAAPLDSMVERITVSAYPNPSVAKRLVVERNASGQRSVVETGDGLTDPNVRLAQVELQIVWNGSDKRSRMRATTTVISNGGISKMNLPGIGFGSGAFDDPPTDPSSGGSTTDPATDPGTDPVTDPVTDPAPTNGNGNGNGNDNGNGKGRGNVGGKPGQG